MMTLLCLLLAIIMPSVVLATWLSSHRPAFQEYSIPQRKLVTDGNDDAKHDDGPFLWTCDDMTPNLCNNIDSTIGSVTTRKGLQIHYWKYFVHDDYKENETTGSPYERGLPVIVINGGPGLPHDYDLPLRQLVCGGNDGFREVIFTIRLAQEIPVFHRVPLSTTIIRLS
jgi:hypothetical protein